MPSLSRQIPFQVLSPDYASKRKMIRNKIGSNSIASIDSYKAFLPFLKGKRIYKFTQIQKENKETFEQDAQTMDKFTTVDAQLYHLLNYPVWVNEEGLNQSRNRYTPNDILDPAYLAQRVLPP